MVTLMLILFNQLASSLTIKYLETKRSSLFHAGVEHIKKFYSTCPSFIKLFTAVNNQ